MLKEEIAGELICEASKNLTEALHGLGKVAQR